MITLFDGVYLLECSVQNRPLLLTVFVGKENTLLLDTGCARHPDEVILPAVKQLGVFPTWIVNTHCDFDHTGGNLAMKVAFPDAIFCCGEADREQVESPAELYRLRYDVYREGHGIFYPPETRDWILLQSGADVPITKTFRGGEKLRLSADWEIEILSLPGHSQGHLGVWDSRHRALYGGDAIHGSGCPDQGGNLSLCPTYLYTDSYLSTIQQIEKLPIDTYVGCHWGVKGGHEIAQFCATSRQFVARAEAEILAALRAVSGGLTLRELCLELGPKLGDWPDHAHIELHYALSGHLENLETRGLVRQIETRRLLRYQV